jgi:hypothetical protein
MGLNNVGQVAFLGNLDGMPGIQGIYTGPDPAADEVITFGDPLFGSTLVNIPNSGEGPNDAGQIVFSYSLADGRRGIALATPVAPSLAGDYNHDDVVDAADYIVWRKDAITGNAASPGAGSDPDPIDYDTWRTHFGETLGSGGNSLAVTENVPEPGSVGLVCMVGVLVCGARLRRGRRG